VSHTLKTTTLDLRMKQNVSAEKHRLKGKTATTNALPPVIHQYD